MICPAPGRYVPPNAWHVGKVASARNNAGKYFKQHEREKDDNFQRRCKEALSWGVSRGIVDLFAQYLFLHPIERELGRLAGVSASRGGNAS
jgi:hypothetical protein